jgi:hypothetical protein
MLFTIFSMAALAPYAITALANAPALINQAAKAGRVFNKGISVGRGIFNTAKSVFGSIFGKRHHHHSRPRPQSNPAAPVAVASNPLEKPTVQNPA